MQPNTERKGEIMEHIQEIDLHDLESISGGRELTLKERKQYEKLVEYFDLAYQNKKAGLGDQAEVELAYNRVLEYVKRITEE